MKPKLIIEQFLERIRRKRYSGYAKLFSLPANKVSRPAGFTKVVGDGVLLINGYDFSFVLVLEGEDVAKLKSMLNGL